MYHHHHHHLCIPRDNFSVLIHIHINCHVYISGFSPFYNTRFADFELNPWKLAEKKTWYYNFNNHIFIQSNTLLLYEWGEARWQQIVIIEVILWSIISFLKIIDLFLLCKHVCVWLHTCRCTMWVNTVVGFSRRYRSLGIGVGVVSCHIRHWVSKHVCHRGNKLSSLLSQPSTALVCPMEGRNYDLPCILNIFPHFRNCLPFTSLVYSFFSVFSWSMQNSFGGSY